MKKPVNHEASNLTLVTTNGDGEAERSSLIKEPFIINGHGFPGYLVEVSEDLKHYTIEVRAFGWIEWVQQVLNFGDTLNLHRSDKGITIPTTLLYAGYTYNESTWVFTFKLKVKD